MNIQALASQRELFRPRWSWMLFAPIEIPDTLLISFFGRRDVIVTLYQQNIWWQSEICASIAGEASCPEHKILSACKEATGPWALGEKSTGGSIQVPPILQWGKGDPILAARQTNHDQFSMSSRDNSDCFSLQVKVWSFLWFTPCFSSWWEMSPHPPSLYCHWLLGQRNHFPGRCFGASDSWTGTA